MVSKRDSEGSGGGSFVVEGSLEREKMACGAGVGDGSGERWGGTYGGLGVISGGYVGG